MNTTPTIHATIARGDLREMMAERDSIARLLARVIIEGAAPEMYKTFLDDFAALDAAIEAR